MNKRKIGTLAAIAMLAFAACSGGGGGGGSKGEIEIWSSLPRQGSSKAQTDTIVNAINMAIEEAGISPEAVEYINYHGTSTELNDKIETRATKLAFNGHAYKLAGSSLKSLIGHPQGACGAASIVSTLLSMRDGVVPPTINVDEPDPECDLDYVPKTARKMEVEYAVSNCIAFGSKNSAMVLRKIHAA